MDTSKDILPKNVAPNTPSMSFHSRGRCVRRKVAMNLDCDTEELLALATEFPRVVLENPLFTIFCFGDSDYFANSAEAQPLAISRLLQIGAIPVFIIEQFASTQNLRFMLALVQNPTTPLSLVQDIKQRLENHKAWDGEDESDRSTIYVDTAGNWDCSTHQHLQEALFFHRFCHASVKSSDWQIVFQQKVADMVLTVADRQATGYGRDELALLKLIPDYIGDRLTLIWSPLKPLANDQATVAAQDSEVPNHKPAVVQRAIAVCQSVSRQELLQWLHDDDPMMQLAVLSRIRAIAKQPLLNVEEAAAILQTPISTPLPKDPLLRLLLAQFTDTPVETLDLLANDDSADVRLCVATNPMTSTLTLSRLAGDRDPQIRKFVCQHPNTSTHCLEERMYDQYSDVRQAAVQAYLPRFPDRLAHVLDQYANQKLSYVAKLLLLMHPLCPEDLLVDGRDSPTWLERCAVASNPSSPANILRSLATDTNVIVREAAMHTLANSHQELSYDPYGT